MNSDLDPSIFDDTFHGCAFAAYVELAIASGGLPDEAATRRRAYQLYEEALAERHAKTSPKRKRVRSGTNVNPTVTNVV